MTTHWNQAEAIALCREVERICPEFGCHVALTGGCLYKDVGTGDTRRDRSEVVLHARRRLNERELAMLTAEWCAIPAVGIAGEGIPW